MDLNSGFPRQKLPYSRKNEAWRRANVDWASARTYFNYAPIRKDAIHMKINYDLLNGKIHMSDVASYLNPDEAAAIFPPDKIQHYPIINAYLNCLRGEASARVFDWRAVVTNPNSISEIEENKKSAFRKAIESIVEDTSIDDDAAQEQVRKTVDFFHYEWQDLREIRANEILKHYMKEQNFEDKFLDGFMDAGAVSEEVFQCDIEGGEPVLRRLNPIKLHAFMSGSSNRIEDADVIIYEDYWSRGRIYDCYYDQLSKSAMEWLETTPDMDGGAPLGAAGNYNDAYGMIHSNNILGEDGVMIKDDESIGYLFDGLSHFDGGLGSDLLPYDVAGNIRVLRVYWKSRRKIKKVRRFDPVTGEELFDFYPETYVLDEAAGETEEIFWVNEPWEGTKIGENIYVNIRPRLVRYNSLDNPSRCHFGIVGTVYNLNESKPFSLVDMMKPYSYLYDAVSHKLVELIASNWGKLLEMDLAQKPKDWAVDKWMFFARKNKILIKDSFNEGNKGAATGKLAGGLNNASKGVIDASWGVDIQYYIELLDAIDVKMAKLIGMTPQRMGQIQNRETVGGVERSTLQSSYTTDWLFQKHSDTIRRVLMAFLETAKCAFRGRTVKFRYILSDNSIKLMEVDGDEFAESDYGIIVDQSNETQLLNQKLDSLAQAAVQNSVMDFASIMRLYSSRSLSEKVRLVEDAERKMRENQERMQQMQMQQQQQLAQMQQQTEMQKMQQQDALNQRDNDTRIRVAEINAQAENLRLGVYDEQNNEKFLEAKADLERQKLELEIKKFDEELRFKEQKQRDDKEVQLKKIQVNKK